MSKNGRKKKRGCWGNDRGFRAVSDMIEVKGQRRARMSYVLGSMNGRRRV